MEKKKIKRDIMLIATLIIVCAAAFLIINFVVKKDGITAVVKVDGNIVYMLPLDKNASVTVEGCSYRKWYSLYERCRLSR